jgi:hypothetical protein
VSPAFQYRALFARPPAYRPPLTTHTLLSAPRHLLHTQPTGIEAARKLQVVLHVPADQELPLLQVLGQYGLAGLAPEQLLLLVQPRGPGYCWDEQLRRFMKVGCGGMKGCEGCEGMGG